MNHLKNTQFEQNAKRYSSYHINRFISMRCAVDMLQEGIFPDAKEITESFGCFEATKYLSWDWNDKRINLISVGDGNTPRTAATFAYRTSWNCFSVDPTLRDVFYNIKRLKLYRNKIEDVRFEFDEPCVIVCVHSHVSLKTTIQSIKAPQIDIIAMECCMPLKLPIKPVIEYNDPNIWSPKNLIRVYKDVH